MRILIYGETSAAKALLTELREAGHHASLRNPQYFETIDLGCDAAYADDERILTAYQSAGVASRRINPLAVESVTEPDATSEPEVKPTPKRKRR